MYKISSWRQSFFSHLEIAFVDDEARMAGVYSVEDESSEEQGSEHSVIGDEKNSEENGSDKLNR
jgi:hypothetical protein